MPDFLMNTSLNIDDFEEVVSCEDCCRVLQKKGGELQFDCLAGLAYKLKLKRQVNSLL